MGRSESTQGIHATGADLEIADKNGRTALLLGLRCYNVRIMEFLLRKGANVNARLLAWTDLCVTFLQGLVRYDSERLVKLALEYGADPEVREDEHRRPLDIALEKELTGIVDIFREVSLPLDVDVESNVESDLETVWRDASSS